MAMESRDQADNCLSVDVEGILLDIEGTTSSISFVYDVMFPYVREHLRSFLEANWDSESVAAVRPLLMADAQSCGLNVDAVETVQQTEQTVLALMDGDHKTTGLKTLQGLIWKAGFHSGTLVAHVYEDVVPALQHWKQNGCDIRIYSSGSIQAQKLFFGHTEAGNLLEYFTAHYDTTTGPKKDAASYKTIAEDFGLPPEKILFVSDVTAELAAATQSGFKGCLSIRPGNPTQDDADQFPNIKSFDEISIEGITA